MAEPCPAGKLEEQGVPLAVRMAFQGEAELLEERQPALGDVLVPGRPLGVVVQCARVTLTCVPPGTGFRSKTSPPWTVRLVWSGASTTPWEVDLIDLGSEFVGLPAMPLRYFGRFAQHGPDLRRVGIDHYAQIVRHSPNVQLRRGAG